MRKLFIVCFLALGLGIAAPQATWAGDNAFQRKEPKGAHKKGARQSTKNKHQEANARRAREQAAKSKRELAVKKAALRRQQTAKQMAKQARESASKKQGGGRKGRR
jgi:hypothetical protein